VFNKVFFLSAACLAFSSGIARDAAPESPVDLPPWYVLEKAISTPAEASSVSTLVDSGRWADRSLSGLRDALAGVPGVLLQDSFGGFEPPRISIRGSGVQSAPTSRGVAFEMDGLPLSLADGSFNSALFDPALAGRIEVYRGLGAWREAPAATGGAINFVTDERQGEKLRAEGGSWGAMRGMGAFSTAIQGFSVGAAIAGSQQDGYRENSAQRRMSFAGNLAMGGTQFSVFASDLAYEVPGPLTLSTAYAAPRSVSSDVLRDQPMREAKALRIAVQHSVESEDGRFDAGLAWMRSDDWFRQLQANGIGDSVSDDLNARVSAGRRAELFGMEHHFALRGRAGQGWREWRRFVNDVGKTGVIFGDDDLQSTNASLQIEDGISLGRGFAASAGGTMSLASRRIGDLMQPVGSAQNISRSWHDRSFLPQTTLTWQHSRAFAIMAGISRSAEAPTFDDMIVVSGASPRLVRKSQSQSLRQQEATNLELGTRGSFGSVSWDLSIYRSFWSNEILRLADAQGLPRGAVNAGRTIHEGIEASLRWQLIPGAHRLSLDTNSVWTHCRFDDDPIYGKGRLAGLPPNQGMSELLFEDATGWFTGCGLEWTAGRTQADHAGKLSYGGAGLLRVRMGYRARKGWTVFADLRNAADRRWIASTAGVLDLARNPAGTSLFLPGIPRTLIVGVEWLR
jgi:iron complex outermembrane receptor protein